ncbi:MAG: site-2 protease family protein [Gemmatimonadetes bacterium]|nr:site-2 protease family protein [Gemmatimonadota bacterium]
MADLASLADALTWFAVFLFSTTLHEASHALAAMRLGDRTAYHGGQVTLDPLPHIRRHPFGMVVLPLLSAVLTGWPIGFASAPYDPAWADRFPRRAAMMALAGPAANLLLALLAAVALRAGEGSGHFYAPARIEFGLLAASELGATWDLVARFTSVLFSMNLLLCVFNLLPFAPLDGSGAITLFMQPATARRYQEFLRTTPMLSWIGLMVAWQLADLVFRPLFSAAVNLLYPGVRYS